MGLDRVDKVILVLPILGFLDVVSTFYASFHGFPLGMCEGGFVAAIFAGQGFLYLYVPIYLGILIGIAYVLFWMKNNLRPSVPLDKLLFLLLVGTVCLIYARLFTTIVMNTLLLSEGKTPSEITGKVVYLFTIGYVSLLVWRPVLKWIREE